MASITKDWFDTLTFELTTEQVFAVNRLLGETQFRFVSYNDATKNLNKVKETARLYEPFEKGGKTSTGMKRPMNSSPELSQHHFIASASPNPTKPLAIYSSNSMQQSTQLLKKLREIVSCDFPQISNAFDFEILEKGITKGYYITLDEFKVAAKQVMRALANKYKNLDFTRKLII